MSDITLEIARAIVLLGITIFLWILGRGRFERNRTGWNAIIGGFGLLLFGSLADITDNFEYLSRFVVIGDTETEAILENFVGFLGGFVFLAFGLIRWNPSVQRLSDEISERKRAEEALKRAHEELEKRVQERTAELQKTNETLKHEITERKRAEEALTRSKENLEDARDEARAANRAKSEFLAAMSHELRTPLNAVLGFSEIIMNQTFGPVGNVKYRDYSRDIHESGQHLLGLINDILDLSKVESGKDELHEDKIQIAETIRSALKLVRQRAEQRGIKLQSGANGSRLFGDHHEPDVRAGW